MAGKGYNADYWGSMSLSGSGRPASDDASANAPGWQASGESTGQAIPGANPDDWSSPVDSTQYRATGQNASYAQNRHQGPFAQGAPHYAYRSGKDHVAAGLLAIFLGSLGIHKFYLGYNSVGFLMLGVTILGSIFTLGLAGMVMEVIGIVEGVIYLSKDQQTFDSMYVYNMKEWF